MTSNEKKPIQIVTYNNKAFVVGLEWRAIKGGLHYMKEVKAIGKRENLDVVAIRQNESIQAGFAPKFTVPLKGKYSLAVSLVSLIPGKWLAVFPVAADNNHYIVIASTGGLVMPWTDKIVSQEALDQEVVDITMRDMSQSPWLIEKINAALARLADGEENLGSALDTAGYEFPSEDTIIKMQSLFETANQEGSLERFGDRLLEKTLINVERQGNVIKLVSMFGGATATVSIVGIMYSLIEIAFNF